MVEPPGTAPGSEPFITSAFIAIVPVARNRSNIGDRRPRDKGRNARARKGKRPVRCGTGRSVLGGAVDQKPALIFSNSCSWRSRSAGSFGVCARTGALIGPSPAVSSSAGSTLAIAAVELWP